MRESQWPRRALDALLKSVARREVDMVAAWSVDRLGRSLTDLLDFLRELHAKGVDLFLHQQGLDTSTPSGRAMFQMMGVFAEFERSMIRERVLAGLARAKDHGRRRLEESDVAKIAVGPILDLEVAREPQASRTYRVAFCPGGKHRPLLRFDDVEARRSGA
jgi:DNA invertase Pin-like site-specific DNA recombinase